jgi:hypothetical protein
MGNDNLIKNKVVSCIESQHRDPEQVLDAFKKVDTTSAINHKAGSEIVNPVYPDSVLQILKNYPDYWHTPMKKVLITGSEGYIGKHLIQMLGNKYDIYKLDLKDPTTPLDIRTVNWDLEFDTVVHLAALVNVSRSTRYPEEYFDTNVNGKNRLLDAIDGFTPTAINIFTGKESLYELNNTITVSKTLPGQGIDFLEALAGVTTPFSQRPGDYLTNPNTFIPYTTTFFWSYYT